ncbi:hypothetical protein LWI29_027852 [Acer saccharum]|uniref:Uncharacterized protein n=1 Tax=Acer saccharum TaxID=4024 RepID=A0AA39RJ96_ACESA|nr:hypothetical protein LWI29_027852 [Acer saccharum]
MKWNLDEEVAKIIETWVALGFDFNGRDDKVAMILARRKTEDEERSHIAYNVPVKGTSSIPKITVTTVVLSAQRVLTDITSSSVYVMVVSEPKVRL